MSDRFRQRKWTDSSDVVDFRLLHEFGLTSSPSTITLTGVSFLRPCLRGRETLVGLSRWLHSSPASPPKEVFTRPCLRTDLVPFERQCLRYLTSDLLLKKEGEVDLTSDRSYQKQNQSRLKRERNFTPTL